MDYKDALDLICDAYRMRYKRDLDEFLEGLADAGRNVDLAIGHIADDLAPIEYEVIDVLPDVGRIATMDASAIESYLRRWARDNGFNVSASAEDRTDYMATDDVADAHPEAGREKGGDDNADLVRFQTEAAGRGELGERKLAEGVNHRGENLLLVEIRERQVTRGERVRWEVRLLPGGKVVAEGGPLYLDDPNFSDAALCASRGLAYDAMRALTDSNMRDLRASMKMADAKFVCPECRQPGKKSDMTVNDRSVCARCAGDIERDYEGEEAAKMLEETKRKKALLQKQTAGLRLTATQRKLVAEIEANIDDYRPEFLEKVGEILKQPWDAGSAWEVVEADGSSKLIRRETSYDPEQVGAAPRKHAYREGQALRIWSDVMPEDVIVRECVGEDRYKVQSELNGRMFFVSEADLYNPNEEAPLFDGGDDYPLDEGGLASLF